MTPLPLYADVHISTALINSLRRHGIDVLTVPDDGRRQEPDVNLLSRAGELGRLMLTSDKHFVQIARTRQLAGHDFPGIVKIARNEHELQVITEHILTLLSCCDWAELRNQVHYIPMMGQ